MNINDKVKLKQPYDMNKPQNSSEMWLAHEKIKYGTEYTITDMISSNNTFIRVTNGAYKSALWLDAEMFEVCKTCNFVIEMDI